MNITWILERDVFNDNHDRLAEAAKAAGHRMVSWDDFWWEDGKWPKLKDDYAIFHGSLGNADRIASELPWRPGAFCNTPAFACSAWYDNAGQWLLHSKWVFSRVSDFVAEPERYLKELDSPQSFFVRPDSPLKPFSGRVVRLDELSLETLDYGFYYDDKDLPIVITPATDVGQEWRFVIAGQKVVASSAYEASDRTETGSDCPPEALSLANEAAKALVTPDPVYILDVCETGGNYRLVEINPFSGADLYACDRGAIVAAVDAILAAF